MKTNETMKNRIESKEIIKTVVITAENAYKVKVVEVGGGNFCNIERLTDNGLNATTVCRLGELSAISGNAYSIGHLGVPKYDAMKIAIVIEETVVQGQQKKLEDLFIAIDEYETEFCTALDHMNDDECGEDVTEDDIEALYAILEMLYDALEYLIADMRSLHQKI